MTMQHDIHPSDERVSAFGSGDPEATADATLAAHVAGCGRCTAIVDDLARLRAALAELPDLVPSRPLQLLPPVPLAPAPTARFGWLRRLATPALATGAGMVLVGAIGLSGILDGSFMAASGAAPSAENAQASERTSTDSNYEGPGASRGSSEPAVQPGSPESPGASPDEGNQGPPVDDGTPGAFRPFTVEAGSGLWLIVLVTGVVLLAGGALVRFAIQPRAG